MGDKVSYWIVKNSHGQYRGDTSFFYLIRIEYIRDEGAYLLGYAWIVTIHNFPCVSDRSNCRINADVNDFVESIFSDAFGSQVQQLHSQADVDNCFQNVTGLVVLIHVI